mmetsp:Transcript_43305/g.92695  ORF Transcript_43305/g.92695 Transcript_43305/m.92695 type:complete len:237 (+) Transcript_43305:3-713(+)
MLTPIQTPTRSHFGSSRIWAPSLSPLLASIAVQSVRFGQPPATERSLRPVRRSLRMAIRVVVTSATRTKIDAVRTAFQEKLHLEGEDMLEVDGLPTDSGIPHGQPWGVQHTYEGAMARLHHLKAQLRSEQGKRYDYLVSAENGVIALPSHTGTRGLDVACVVVEHCLSGRWEMSMSQARPYPLEEVQRMSRDGATGHEIGDYCRQWYEAKGLLLTREGQVSSATSMALELLGSPSS